ncbi:MAG: glycosyl hydrolase family 18 protein [Cyclobacteriaceae bacterium]
MRLKLILLFSFFSFFLFQAQGQKSDNQFKVVGYYSMRSAMETTKRVPFKNMTHINLWFLNPDSLGNFTQDLSGLKPFIEKAHKKKARVLFSIGGGSKQTQYRRLLQDDKRAMFINNLLAVALNTKVDGIDVDLEGSDIDDNYENFIVELSQALKKHNKLITAAIAIYYKDQFTDKALAQFDFVNVMSYDRTGPWRPEKPGPHAAYEHAVQDLEYFGIERKIPKEKMTLGVPFYGYGYGPELTSPAMSMNFAEIVSSFRGAEKVDQWTRADGKIIYYNGIPTIRKKTELAMQKASGIMIWQVRGDAKGAKSLLKTINKVAN